MKVFEGILPTIKLTYFVCEDFNLQRTNKSNGVVAPKRIISTYREPDISDPKGRNQVVFTFGKNFVDHPTKGSDVLSDPNLSEKLCTPENARAFVAWLFD